MTGRKNGVIAHLTRRIFLDCGEGETFDDNEPVPTLVYQCHCILHRLNLAINFIWKSESVDESVCILADKIEILMKYCYNFFNRSSERRASYKKLIQAFSGAVLPASWCETRWLSRMHCIDAVYNSKDAII